MKYTIFNQRFGVEIERTAGCERKRIAEAIKTVVGGRITQEFGTYQASLVTQSDGRIWRIQNDASITTIRGQKGSEIISPILTYDDIPTLQLIILAVKAAGCVPHRSCSTHVHCSCEPHTPQSLMNLAKIFYRNEELLFQAVGTSPERRAHYTKPMEQEFIDRLLQHKPETMEDLNRAWFGQYTPHPEHYHKSRYCSLNLVNVFRAINTVEFRLYQASLNPQRITAWIQLSLALSARALDLKKTTHTKIETDNPKFNFRVFMVAGLGMKGKEFKTARTILLKNLPGNSAWRYGKPQKNAEVANVQ